MPAITYADALNRAASFVALSATDPNGVKIWNALDDDLVGKMTMAQGEEMLRVARNHHPGEDNYMAAQVIVTILEVHL